MIFKKKTTQQEVHDYIVKMERATFEQTGKSGVYPTAGQLQLVFGISNTMVHKYYKAFDEKLKRNLRYTPVAKMDKVIRIKK